MSTITIIILVVMIISLVIGLLLSGSGTTTGLAALSGQDLELFRKTKDRGFIKILQIIMFLIAFLTFIGLIVVKALNLS